MIADALIAHREGRSVAYSRNRNKYVGMQVYDAAWTYSNFVWAANDIERVFGLISETRGKRWPEGKGHESTFDATECLLRDVGLDPVLRQDRRNALVLKDEAKTRIGFRHTDRTRADERQILSFNEALGAADIVLDAPDVAWAGNAFVTVPGAVKRGKNKGDAVTIRSDQIWMYRVYNESWSRGGRYYGHWLQGLSADRRGQARIDGKPVNLLDIGGSHIAILYAKSDRQLDFDPYVIPNVERHLAKVALLILINAVDGNQARAAMAQRVARLELDLGDDEDAQPRPDHYSEADRIMHAVEARHAPIASAFCSGSGAMCQYEEAEVIGETMAASLKRGIVTVPIHDELIVPVEQVGIVTDLLQASWHQRFGQFPFL